MTASELEPIDQAIARELAEDGRCSFTDLAERVGLSVSAVHQRVRRLEHIREIEACYSVAGDESYILLVRVASPAALEELLRQSREAAKVSTRTTVVLSTPYEGRSPAL